MFLAFLLTGCSLDASLIEPRSLTSPQDQTDPSLKIQRTSPDFISGEVVTTGNGVVMMGIFGEISEKKTLSNGVTIEGAFYE